MSSADSESMRVTVVSLLTNPRKGITLRVQPQQSIADLINQFKREAKIKRSIRVVLLYRDNKQLNNDWTVDIAGLKDGDTLFAGIEGEDIAPDNSTWFTLTLLSFLVGTIGLICILSIFFLSGKLDDEFGIVFDAGSTHTQLFIYRWPGRHNQTTGIISEFANCTVDKVGIATYANQPQKVELSIRKGLNCAVQKIPSRLITKTSLYLGATAGMRLLNESDHSKALLIMIYIEKAMKSYAFQFKSAEIISGETEAVSDWITANYAANKLQKNFIIDAMLTVNNSDTLGILDLGGASIEIAYQEVERSDFCKIDNIAAFGHNYSVCSESLLCLGATEMLRQYRHFLIQNSSEYSDLIENPCGYFNHTVTVNSSDIYQPPCVIEKIKNETVQFIGTGQSELCKQTLESILQTNYAHVLNKTYDISGNFLAFSAYYKVMQFFNATDISLESYMKILSSYCNRTIFDAFEYLSNSPYLYEECFYGNLVLVYLTLIYGFNESTWKNLNFTDQVFGSDLDWSLGFMLNETVQNIKPPLPEHLISNWLFICFVVLFALFLLFAATFCMVASRRRHAYQRLAADDSDISDILDESLIS